MAETTAPTSPPPAQSADTLTEGIAKLDVAAKDEAPAAAATEDKPAAETNGAAAPTTAASESASDAGAAAAATATPAARPAGGNQASQAAQAPNASLYVGELDPTVTEAMLYEIFSMIGPVASIRVCRDAVTRRSLGYSYVNYINQADGERALETLNYSLIKGKACRIMWSQRDPALRKTGTGNIFLKNLDETIDNKALHDTFAAFGNILSCKVVLDENGLSKGFGFVHFETNEAADNAIANVNGMLLNDKIVYVGHHVPKRERQAKMDEVRANFTNLYVKGVALEASDEDFHALFAKFGTITSAVVSREPDGKSKGFGFVNFDNHDAAESALNELNETEWRGQQLLVTRAQKKSEREDELRKAYAAQKFEKDQKFAGVNLYVKNIDDDMEEERLQAEFAPFGSITSCRIMRDDKGASKGFGFVCYSAPEEATKAVTELNGKMVGTKPLYVALAQPKEVRRQQLEAQVAQRNQMRNAQMGASGIAPMVGGPGMPGMPGMPNPYGMPPQMMQQFYGGPQGYAAAQAAAARGGYPGQPGGYPAQPGPQQRGGPPGAQPPQQRYAPPGQMPMPQGYGYPGGYPPRGPFPPQGQPGQPQPGQPGQPPAGARAPPQAGRPNGVPPQQLAQQRGAGGLNAQALAAASPADRKQLLGESLYPQIHATEPELAGKITGMLLEMDDSELIQLISDPAALGEKVAEAKSVLAAYQQQQEA